MYICTLSKSLVYELPHVAQFPLPQWAIEEQEANFVADSTAFAWRLVRLAILGLCNEGTWTDTCLAWYCKGVVLTDNGTCGNTSSANSLGRASSTLSCVCYHSSEQLTIVVCCLHASCLQFTAVQQQKWAASRQYINSNILKCVLANGYCCYTLNKSDISSNKIYIL